MTTRVEFYATLREITGCHELTLDLPAETSVAALIDHLVDLHPGLAAWRSKFLIAADLDYVDEHHLIHPGETISLMPPGQGG